MRLPHPENHPALETHRLTKRFGSTVALDELTLRVEPGTIVGLVGKNGSGKTTLLRHLAGLALPSAGWCRVLGAPSESLDDRMLQRLGVVHQETRFLGWMSVRRHLAHVRSFYERWDDLRERRLLEELDLDPSARVGKLSPGNVQKLAVITAVCHHPDLLLLDEPVAALDPIARERMLAMLLELLNEDGTTILVSSHVLRDVERVVDWIVCLDRGRGIVDASLDDLRERFAEWKVVSTNGGLPERFAEGFVLSQSGDRHQAHLYVRDAADAREAFEARYRAVVEACPLDLERMFPLWMPAGAASEPRGGAR